MQALRDAGSHFSIDDFGTGYSSLTHYLKVTDGCLKNRPVFCAGFDD
jgi:EAL domain-containing protein (putative c-di-GMP-specific phosphodiesterase class I)